MKEFKIRCSAIGDIMANGTDKKSMGKGAMTFCQQWVKEQVYARRKEFTSKYTDKGNICEDNSLDFIADQLNLGLLFKNEQHFKNDFITGTPDAVLPEMIIDVKNSWDFTTFPLFDQVCPNKDYEWQMLGYMALTGKQGAKLIYVLSDTPINLIEKEAYWWCKNNGYDELDMDIFDQFKARMTYPDIPAERKIKVFDIARDESKIEAIKARVQEAREYIKTLKY
jgi:hypothetical protein